MIYVVTLFFVIIFGALIYYLVSHDRGPKEPVGALWIASLFGLLALAISGGMEHVMGIGFEGFPAITQVLFMESIFVGTIEEFAKFIPLALYINKKNYFNEHNDGIIYFAICGLTFGLFENFLYTFVFGPGIGIIRLILLPIFHGASASAVGYFFAKKKINGNTYLNTVLALLTVSFMHALYNFGLDSKVPILFLLSLMITILLTSGLFIFYMLANEQDKKEGISASGNDRFCRFCGSENLNHSLYCEHCGKKF